MSKNFTDNENFTVSQLRQIDSVTNAASELMHILLTKPAYLDKTNLKGLKEDEFPPVTASEIADVVSDYLVGRGYNIFFPTHISYYDSENNLRESFSHTYNVDKILEKKV